MKKEVQWKDTKRRVTEGRLETERLIRRSRVKEKLNIFAASQHVNMFRTC